ncbi:hypothetical protein AB6N24_00355 [Cellulomonas sp. 179-A 4D5 NHS]|uniref:hypothetical protein n=1 Tax=Cellulomonas sp. 179-A 4D5 NHS TaxID=3142378 RepID=UPI0039A37BEF
MIPKQTAASVELPASTSVVWRVLTSVVEGDQGEVWHLEHTDVSLDVVAPGEAADGSARWEGLDFRVAVHLVPMATGGTLLLLTADPVAEAHGVRATAHASASHRLARHDLEKVALAVGRKIAELDDGP